MDFYWIYDLPEWLFFLITISFFALIALLGTIYLNPIIVKKLGIKEEHNSTVDTYLSLSSVFYGITLGLIAVSSYENFNFAEEKVNNESSALGALYRDVSILAKPEKQKLLHTLKNYTSHIVDVSWPANQRGERAPNSAKVDSFQVQLVHYIPETEQDKIIYAQVFEQFNNFYQARRQRLNALNVSLPYTIYLILFLGAFINLTLTWCMSFSNKKLNICFSVLCGMLIGSLVFLIAVMDNPFRGSYSVKATSFQLLLDGMMRN
jgi:hypothetical protein